MDWRKAQDRIRDKIKVGTDVNSDQSHHRKVKSVDDEGFVVPRSKNQCLRISWDMLEKCFSQLSKPSGFNRAFFKEEFPECCVREGNKTQGHLNHDCYIHTIGQIFVKAEVARAEKEGQVTTFRAL